VQVSACTHAQVWGVMGLEDKLQVCVRPCAPIFMRQVTESSVNMCLHVSTWRLIVVRGPVKELLISIISSPSFLFM